MNSAIPRFSHFYGRRRGRKLRPAQERHLAEGMARFGVRLPADGTDAIDPRDWFDFPCRRLYLEIGFGGGEHLAMQAGAMQAGAAPEDGFIGAEPFLNGVASLCRHVSEKRLTNIRIWDDDVRLLLPRLAGDCFDGVFILFPDPWPKKRHGQRRLIQRETLDQLAERIRSGGFLLLASDDPVAKSWLLETTIRHPAFDWQARRPADWRSPPENGTETRYMKKARREGRKPAWFLFFRR